MNPADSPQACLGTAAVTLLAVAAFVVCIAAGAPSPTLDVVTAALTELDGGCE